MSTKTDAIKNNNYKQYRALEGQYPLFLKLFAKEYESSKVFCFGVSSYKIGNFILARDFISYKTDVYPIDEHTFLVFVGIIKALSGMVEYSD